MLTFNHERRKSIMKLTKIITKLALCGALLGSAGGIAALTTPNVVRADASDVLPTATTKDYNKLLALSKKPGAHYTKRKWYINWMPGNNVANVHNFKTGKLYDMNYGEGPGRMWQSAIGAGTIHGQEYIIEYSGKGSLKCLIPAEYYHVPYGFKFKKGHKPVKGYYGSLAGASNGYYEYADEYGRTFTQENTVYSDRKDGYRYIKQSYDGQNQGKNKGFFIGLTAIPMNDGHSYYPLYSYAPDDSPLEVLYIRTEDIDQFKPAKVTYKYCGTLNKTKGTNYYHSFKPYKKKV